ncbi:MAG: hypothetical protein WEA99_05200 [Brumimicrobium sp.]
MKTKYLSLIKSPTYWLFLVFALAFGQTNAQSDSTKLYISDLYKSWKSTYSAYDFDHQTGQEDQVHALFDKQFTDSNRVKNFLVDFKNLESDYYKGDYGLGMNAGFMNNPTGGEQDFDNVIYRSRFIADVGWDILRSGYLHNKLKSQIASNESRIAEIEDKELEKNASFAILWNYVIFQFNLQKIKVLDQRMSLAQNRIDVVKKLYLLNKVNQEELLKNLEGLAEIRSMYKVYKDFNEQLKKEYQFTSTDTLDLPLIDINYSIIKEKLAGKQEDSIIHYMKENIDLKHKFTNDVSLRTFVRYSYYDLVSINPSSRDFFSLGVTLGIPLNFNRKAKKDWIALQKESVDYIPEDERITIQKSILNNYYEYRYKLKQFTSMHYKRLLFKELLRKENARYAIDYLSFNPVSSLRLMDDLMKIDIEMLDLKQQMYLKLISIHTEIPYNEIDELYSAYSLEDKLDNIYSSNRSVYIWDKTFSQFPLNFLLSYMEKEAYDRAVISYSQNEKNNRIKQTFIDTLRSNNVKIELMTGKNALIESDPRPYFNEITSSVNFDQIDAIHLDVEPHTLEDWSENKTKYLELYIELLDKTLEFCDEKGVKLTVSVPLHYPKEYLDKIYDRCDYVYFMAYENVKTDYIVRKVKDFEPEKTIIALRTEDFNNLLDMETKIIDIQTEYKPASFIFHDLRRVIEMEKK